MALELPVEINNQKQKPMDGSPGFWAFENEANPVDNVVDGFLGKRGQLHGILDRPYGLRAASGHKQSVANAHAWPHSLQLPEDLSYKLLTQMYCSPGSMCFDIGTNR